MFAQITVFDQAQRQAQDQAIEQLYLDGIGDAVDGRPPAIGQIEYLQGYCEGMKHLKVVELFPIASQKEKEFPLVCGQCTHLNNSRCAIKSITRNSNQYACDRIKVDCPF